MEVKVPKSFNFAKWINELQGQEARIFHSKEYNRLYKTTKLRYRPCISSYLASALCGIPVRLDWAKGVFIFDSEDDAVWFMMKYL